MQSIIHTDASYFACTPVLDKLETLYADTSEKRITRRGTRLIQHEYPQAFRNIMQLFEQAGYEYNLTYTSKTFQKLNVQNMDSRNIILCFSGGKDSLAALLHYQKRGYNVIPYHVTGLNKSYTTEIDSARTIAEKLELPLIVEDISYKGRHDWVEHPLKNIIMAGMALNYAIKNNIGYKVAVGNFYTARLADNAFEVCAGDCIEMWKAWEKVIQTVIPKFHVYVPLQTYHTSYNILIRSRAEYLVPDVQSCMTPNRFRKLFRNRTQKKYKTQLMPDRCGCCWKCAVEYIWMVDNAPGTYLERNRDYYIHCLEILLNTCKKEMNMLYYVIGDLWKHYFFYPMSRSAFGRELQDAVIRGTKIKITAKDA